MDTTAAAELGMGDTEDLEDVGEWNDEGWQEQDYEFVPPVKAGKSTRGTRSGEVNEYGLSATSQGRSGPGQGRPASSGPEPPHKRIRTTALYGRQGTTADGQVQENGVYEEEEDYGDGGQGLDVDSGQNFDSDDWYGAQSASAYGHPGTSVDGGWYPSYGPGVTAQPQMIDPRMLPTFYHDPMSYGQAGPINFFGVSAPTPGGGAGSGMGRGNTARIFYKTKLCSKFKAGTCTFDAHCNFAHGAAELRKPPPGWDSSPVVQNQNGWGRSQPTSASNPSDGRGQKGRGDFQRPHKTRPCKNYFIDGVCPYGDNCSFLHEVEGMQPRGMRENSSWGPRRAPGVNRRGGRGGSGSSRSLTWKTKMCRRWETTGECHFGENCHYAHGTTGLKASVEMKAPIHGGVNTYEEWDDGNEWDGQESVEMGGQPNQSSKNDYSAGGFYSMEKYGGQYFPQSQQNVAYYYPANNHNGAVHMNPNKRTVARGNARNFDVDHVDDEQEYFQPDADHRENNELHA